MDGNAPIHVIQSSTGAGVDTGAIPPRQLRELSDAELNGALADAIAAVRLKKLDLAESVATLKRLITEHDRRTTHAAVTAPPPAA